MHVVYLGGESQGSYIAAICRRKPERARCLTPMCISAVHPLPDRNGYPLHRRAHRSLSKAHDILCRHTYCKSFRMCDAKLHSRRVAYCLLVRENRQFERWFDYSFVLSLGSSVENRRLTIR